LRLKDIEAGIAGRSLPLSERERTILGAKYREAAIGLPEGLALQFGVLLDGALDILAR
jgi:hypothetical protein